MEGGAKASGLRMPEAEASSGGGLGDGDAAVETAAMAMARWQQACEAEVLTALQDGHELLLRALRRHCTCTWYRHAVESDHGLLDELWGSVARALSRVARTRSRLRSGAPASQPSPLEAEGSAPSREASSSVDRRLQTGRSSAGSVDSLPEGPLREDSLREAHAAVELSPPAVCLTTRTPTLST